MTENLQLDAGGISPHDLRELADSIWLTEQCNRYAKGQCLTRRCLIRGGYSGTGPVEDPDCATCEAKEIAAALHEAADIEALSGGSLTTTTSLRRGARRIEALEAAIKMLEGKAKLAEPVVEGARTWVFAECDYDCDREALVDAIAAYDKETGA